MKRLKNWRADPPITSMLDQNEPLLTEVSLPLENYEAICPLCSQIFPQDELHQHIAAEPDRCRRNTFVVIQAYHPNWVRDHGACETCWKSYRDAGRVLDHLRRARPQRAGTWRLGSALRKSRGRL